MAISINQAEFTDVYVQMSESKGEISDVELSKASRASSSQAMDEFEKLSKRFVALMKEYSALFESDSAALLNVASKLVSQDEQTARLFRAEVGDTVAANEAKKEIGGVTGSAAEKNGAKGGGGAGSREGTTQGGGSCGGSSDGGTGRASGNGGTGSFGGGGAGSR